MTTEEFLTALSKTSKWHLDDGALRRQKLFASNQCPITAVAYELLGERDSPGNYFLAGLKLGLPSYDIHAVARASDSETFTEYAALRQQMLRACKIGDNHE